MEMGSFSQQKLVSVFIVVDAVQPETKHGSRRVREREIYKE
jgi:hypothetical protein